MERGGRQRGCTGIKITSGFGELQDHYGASWEPFFSRRSDSDDEDSDFNAQWRISAGSVN